MKRTLLRVLACALLALSAGGAHAQLASLTTKLETLRGRAAFDVTQWNTRIELVEAHQRLLAILQSAADDAACDPPSAFDSTYNSGSNDAARALYSWTLDCKAAALRHRHRIILADQNLTDLELTNHIQPPLSASNSVGSMLTAMTISIDTRNKELAKLRPAQGCTPLRTAEADYALAKSGIAELEGALAKNDVYAARIAHGALVAAAVEARARSDVCPSEALDDNAQVWLDALEHAEELSGVRTAREIEAAACASLRPPNSLPEVCRFDVITLDGEFSIHQALAAQAAPPQ